MLLKKLKFHLKPFVLQQSHLIFYWHGFTSRYVKSMSRFQPRYQSRCSMYIRGLIPGNLAGAVPIDITPCIKINKQLVVYRFWQRYVKTAVYISQNLGDFMQKPRFQRSFWVI